MSDGKQEVWRVFECCVCEVVVGVGVGGWESRGRELAKTGERKDIAGIWGEEVDEGGHEGAWLTEDEAEWVWDGRMV